MNFSLAIIVLSVSMSSMAHLLLKKGMISHSLANNTSESMFNLFWSVGTNPWVMIGMVLHVGALIVWLWALSKVDISFAYPFIALGYVFVGLLACFWLGEQISPLRLIGMTIIVVGVIVLARAG